LTETDARTPALEVPEPGLTPGDVVARAEAMRARLLELQAETEAHAGYSDETHGEFARAGFYRLLAPRRFGGYEFDLTTYYRVMIAVSRGCPSTGWQLCLAGAHCLQLASYWDERAQIDLFGPDGHFLASMSQTSQDALATPVDGGYRLRGTWHYASGIPHATHHMAFARVAGGEPGAEPETVMAVVPRADFTMLDDWGGLIGLKGSGSQSVRVDDAFVPAHHVIPFGMFQDLEHGSPGYRLHGNPLYAGQFMGTALGTINCVQVGNAQAVLDEYERLITSRRTMAMVGRQGVPRFEDRDFQRCFGLGMSYVDAAESIVLRTGDLYLEYSRQGVEEGIPFSPERTMRLYGQQMTAHKLCWEAGDLLFRTSSSSGAMDGTRMQRYWRDLSAMRANGLHQLDFRAPSIAHAHFGLPIGFL
jgi:3-hydroxy-9,10-secoandrosta-1,3,5(10)-triene-9,17-dione monooxygenase